MTDPARVFAVNTTLSVDCTLFILAPDLHEARIKVQAVDLQDFFTFDPDSLSTVGADLLKICDVHTTPISPIAIFPITAEEYAPNEHPDFGNLPTK